MNFATRMIDSPIVPAIERSNLFAAMGRTRARAIMAVMAWSASTVLKVTMVRNVSVSSIPNRTISPAQMNSRLAFQTAALTVSRTQEPP